MADSPTNVSWGEASGTGPTALSTIDGILKEDYVTKSILDTVNMQTYLLSKFNTEEVTGGRRFVLSVRFAVGEGQGNRTERQALPSAGFGEYLQPMGNTVSQFGVIDISGEAIAATSGNKAAFVSALTQALQDCRDGFKLETHRQLWSTGDGTIALADATGSGTSIPVRDPYGLSYVESRLENSQRVRAFRVGMNILFKTAGVITKVTGVGTDGTITVADSVSYTLGEKIIRGDSTTLSNENKEYLGVSGTVSATGTYLTLARAGLPGWQSNVIQMNGAALSEDVLQQAFDTASIQGDGVSKPDLLISEHVCRRIYVRLLMSLKRFPNTLKLEGGFDEDALDFNGRPYVVDKMCPPQRLYYLTTKNWYWYVMKQVGWEQQDGHVLKWVPGFNTWQGFLSAYRQIVCQKPANQTVVSGITHSITQSEGESGT